MKKSFKEYYESLNENEELNENQDGLIEYYLDFSYGNYHLKFSNKGKLSYDVDKS